MKTSPIYNEINRSRFLIADFTHGEDGVRGGVYFEAGYAKGRNISIIWCKKNDESKMHFDTNRYPHIFWEDVDDLKAKLVEKICAFVGVGPGDSSGSGS